MARLVDPHSGSTVNVEDEFGEVLVSSFGYKPAEEAKKTTAKKPSPSKTND